MAVVDTAGNPVEPAPAPGMTPEQAAAVMVEVQALVNIVSALVRRDGGVVRIRAEEVSADALSGCELKTAQDEETKDIVVTVARLGAPAPVVEKRPVLHLPFGDPRGKK